MEQNRERVLDVIFFRTASGTEPVRDWLKHEMDAADRQIIGSKLLTVQWRWPLGMPLVRKMDPELWELRCSLESGIARVFFSVQGKRLVVLHGFFKKSQKTPAGDLEKARIRLRIFRRNES